jgi:hypothetical protein
MVVLELTDKELRTIETGPRQCCLFTAEENEVEAEQERVMTHITAAVQMHGHAPVLDFVREAAAELALSPFRILQHLFWLAHDLKLHFRKHDGLVAPSIAKQHLVESPQSPLRVVFNKPVDEALFAGVKAHLMAAAGDPALGTCDDQIEFARLAARHIRDWKQSLESCRHLARQPGFPGEKDIDAGLERIETISTKLDAFSLIHTLSAHRQAITGLAEEVRLLSDFYRNHGERWQMLVQWADEFQRTIGPAPQDPDAEGHFSRFKQIVSSQRPYARVDDAWQLMEALRPVHERIVVQQTRQGRAEAIAAAEALVQKMKKHLHIHAASQDLSNRSLYALRTQIQNIHAAKTIDRIKHHLQAAEEDFETAWDEVLEQDPNAHQGS